MSDCDREKSDCLKSPNSNGHDSSLDSNGDDNARLQFRGQTPSANTLINNNNNNNNVGAAAAAIVDETQPLLLRRVGERDADDTTISTTSNSKKKTHKPKKKKGETVKGSSNNNNNNNGTHAFNFEQPSYPLFCKKCLGNTVGKKGERSDTFVVTCSKCGYHEVLLKPDGSGVVKMDNSDPEWKGDFPTGNLMEAVWKSAQEKIRSALREDFADAMYGRKQMESLIHVYSRRLQNCSRQCADLYPLIIILRSLQFKKTSSEPLKSLETEIKSRLSALEDSINDVEAFETKHLKKFLDAHAAEITTEALAATAEDLGVPIPPVLSSSPDNATPPESKEPTPQSNSSLFDQPLTADSPTNATTSTSVSVQTPTVTAGQASGSAPATGNASDSTGTVSTKTKSSIPYIEKVEKLTVRLDVMHAQLTKYCLLQTSMTRMKAEEAIAKSKRTQEEAESQLYNFTLGLVDQCKGTTRDCLQKMEMRKKTLRKKERMLAELREMSRKYVAEGNEEGVRQIEQMLQQLNLQN